MIEPRPLDVEELENNVAETLYKHLLMNTLLFSNL